MIDLRSDTLTRPTAAMREAMVKAEVGDDVYGEDPTVRALEERVAGLFGHKAALFTATGSMANVLALRTLVRPGEEVLCESSAHIARAELGAHAAYTGITMRTWTGDRGAVDLPMDPPDVRRRTWGRSSCRPRHCRWRTPTTSAAVRSSTRGSAVAPGLRRRGGLAIHLDGARLWNAQVATGVPISAYGVARTRGVPEQRALARRSDRAWRLGRAAIREARVWRKRLGAGWRQAGVLAAAGLYAVEHNVERLAEDHEHARILAEACGVDPATVDTNIVVVDRPDAGDFVKRAAAEGVVVAAVGPTAVRMVTHLDVDRAAVVRAAEVFAAIA